MDSNKNILFPDERDPAKPFMINNKAFKISTLDSSGASLTIESSTIKDATVLINNEQIKSEYNIAGYPSFYLIDRNGKIVIISLGAHFVKILDEIIKQYL